MSAVRMHERIAVKLNPETCHVFTADGLACRRSTRHPLADVGRVFQPRALMLALRPAERACSGFRRITAAMACRPCRFEWPRPPQ